MNYGMKLLIPIGLGILAAVFNWMALASRTSPNAFTVVSKEIAAGKALTRDDLASVQVPHDLAVSLKQTAVPYEEHASLIGEKTLRDMQPGDLVLWQDTPARGEQIDFQPQDAAAVVVPLNGTSVPPLRVGDEVNFRLPVRNDATKVDEIQSAGPFRLLTVGRLRNYERSNSNMGDHVDHVTVAFPPEKNWQAHHRMLQTFLDRRLQGEDLAFSIIVVNSIGN